MGRARQWRCAGKDRRRPISPVISASRSSRLHQGRSCLDRVARWRQARAPVLRSGQGERPDLVAGWKPVGIRVQSRRSLLPSGFTTSKTTPLSYLTPSTNKDESPIWSAPTAHESRIRDAPATAGPPRPISDSGAASVGRSGLPRRATETGHAVWKSPNTLPGFISRCRGAGPTCIGAARQSLGFSWRTWMNGRTFIAVSVAGGTPVLLTPGAFYGRACRRKPRSAFHDLRTPIRVATAGDRRSPPSLFRVAVDHPGSVALTFG